MEFATLTIMTYVIYLMSSTSLTIWVAKTLHRNGRLLLMRWVYGDEHLADSVNHLLVFGFYLINIRWVTLALKYGLDATHVAGVFESLSKKIGFVLLLLGVMHFMNLYLFNRMRRDAELREAPPPVAPDEMLTTGV